MKIVENNQGAADRIVEIIKPLFARSSEAYAQKEVLLATKFSSMKSLILPPLSTLYGAVTRARSSLYQRGTFRSSKLADP
jgi:hypothetical protein